VYPLTDFGREVKVYCATCDAKQAHLAIAAGVDPGYMADIMRGKRDAEWLKEVVRQFMSDRPDGLTPEDKARVEEYNQKYRREA